MPPDDRGLTIRSSSRLPCGPPSHGFGPERLYSQPVHRSQSRLARRPCANRSMLV